ncbi:MAG: GFA family protein [Alphaproteobacteria bacterium]
MSSTPLTGGCQCGAVRYVLRGELLDPHICHRRMCQKATGNFFASLVGVRLDGIEWTRGTPAVYRSSTLAERGFCPAVYRSSTLAERGFCSACGTSLSFRYLDGDIINVSIGSLDEPERVKPARQYGVESRLPWLEELIALPHSRTEDDMPAEVLARKKNHQHPDYEDK